MKTKKQKPITKNEIHDLTMRYLNGKILSRIWLSFGTLFLEFGDLDEEGRKGEVSFMIEPSWRRQSDYRMKESSDQSRESLEKGLKKYVGKRLNYCLIDDYLHEIHLDFRDVIFVTLSTFNDDALGWTIFFNEHINCDDDAFMKSAMLRNDKKGIYFSPREARVETKKEANKKPKQKKE